MPQDFDVVAQPTGTVTLVFTDIEGSTRLLEELGADAYREALEAHRRAVRQAFGTRGGYEVDEQGDAFFYAFASAGAAVSAVDEAMEALASGRIRVRVGIHTGEPGLDPPKYVGMDVHRAARIMAAAHGGQVVVSQSTRDLLDAPDQLRDLGEHRLKDLSAPVRLYQLGPGEYGPLTTLYRTNLPVPATAFHGRERELAEVVSLLRRSDVRLLTLTGPGGTGKTRLALQAAAEVADDFPDGNWWVPLAALRDPQLVLQTAAQVIGAPGDLSDHIGGKVMLALFDNFEQVVDAAGDVGALLAACPNLMLVATSREPLRLSAEQEYPVPPFAPSDGVGFFIARASAARPDFVAGPEAEAICDRLDGLPLALELAAARVRTLSVAQILERLGHRLPLLTEGARDAPDRQRTLSATISWSYELLAPQEQRLFARLAAFRGGCTLPAAERVLEADLGTLESLVEKSLLRARDERFWMLETIREYAAERLDDSDESAQIRRHHADHHLELAESAQPYVRDEWVSGGGERLDELEREHDNLRAALDWFGARDERQLVLRLAAALSEFWIANNHFGEGRERLEQALASDETRTVARATALNALSLMASLTGDHETMRLRAEEALTIYRALGHERGIADSLFVLGNAAAAEHELPSARQLLQESAELYRRLGEYDTALWASRGLAQACMQAGDLDGARTMYEESLEEAVRLGNRLGEAALLESLAALAVTQERGSDARPLLHRALGLRRELGDPAETAACLCNVAHTLAAVGESTRAAQLLAAFETLRAEIGGAQPWIAEMSEATSATLRSQLAQPVFAAAWDEGETLTIDQAVTLAIESTRAG